MSERERVAGGVLAKLAGRAQELAGAALGREERVENDAGRRAAAREGERIAAEERAERSEAGAEAGELGRQARRAEEAADTLEPKGRS